MNDNLTPPAPVLPFHRQCWIPEVTEGDDGGLFDSKFSGRPWLAADEDWPCCKNCQKPMQLFVQLNLAELPQAEKDRLGDKGLVQFFYCTSTEPHCELDMEGWEPFSGMHLSRWIENPTTDVNETAEGPQSMLKGGRITGWELADDYPAHEELISELGVALTGEQEDEYFEMPYPAAGEKLGGWPFWVQGVEYPSCPECGTTMEFVFQVDSNCNLDFMFGDSGAGHITRCRHHHHIMTFGWACY